MRLRLEYRDDSSMKEYPSDKEPPPSDAKLQNSSHNINKHSIIFHPYLPLSISCAHSSVFMVIRDEN